MLLVMLLVFGVMGFGTNLFFRSVYLYCEWQEGNPIDWRWQALVTLGIPAAYVLVMAELMTVTGVIFVP
jgi:hypothetical protein